MNKVKGYLSLVKFSHTIFAMPFALIGFFLGIKVFNSLTGFFTGQYFRNTNLNETGYYQFPMSRGAIITRLILVILCMVFARSAAMGFNRWLDATYDALNPRTAIREIPAGIITSKNALLFVIINCVAFVACCYFINLLCFWLSFVALFIILFYSYTKRITPLCHLILGLGLSLAPIGAFLAVTGRFQVLPILFSITVLFWVGGFDIIYALQDEEFDKSNHLWSIPAALGKVKALHVSEIFHLLSTASIIWAGIYGHFHIFYWIGVCVFVALLLYQHSIVKVNDLSRINVAFMTANGIASVIFSIFVLMDLYIY